MAQSPSDQQQFIAQSAAIPYRVDRRTGLVEVLLIRRTSDSKPNAKWGIPKGLVDPGLNHEDAAHMEAMQEAGVGGPLTDEPIGQFSYEKFGNAYLVQVYGMRVNRVRDHWDEEDWRQRRWFPIDEAADTVGREAVSRLIRRLARRLKAR